MVGLGFGTPKVESGAHQISSAYFCFKILYISKFFAYWIHVISSSAFMHYIRDTLKFSELTLLNKITNHKLFEAFHIHVVLYISGVQLTN